MCSADVSASSLSTLLKRSLMPSEVMSKSYQVIPSAAAYFKSRLKSSTQSRFVLSSTRCTNAPSLSCLTNLAVSRSHIPTDPDYVVQSVISSEPGREQDRDKVIAQMKTRIFERESAMSSHLTPQ